jgi:DNA repair ATPase RecN
MANEALKELQLAVYNFKEVVDGLAEVKDISKNVKTSADNFQQACKELTEYTDELAISADRVETLCMQIIENNKQTVQSVSDALSDAQKAILHSNESAAELITKCNDTVITKVLDSNEQTAKNITDCVANIQAQVTEYSMSVQKSLDEIRLQNTNNARELRDNISYVKADLAVKLDRVQTSVSNLLDKNKSDHTFIMLGAISATIAAIASIVGIFL